MNLLLDYFECNNYDELNKNSEFREMLYDICENRDEIYLFWFKSRNGFSIISEDTICEFEWINHTHQIIKETLLYS